MVYQSTDLESQESCLQPVHSHYIIEPSIWKQVTLRSCKSHHHLILHKARSRELCSKAVSSNSSRTLPRRPYTDKQTTLSKHIQMCHNMKIGLWNLLCTKSSIESIPVPFLTFDRSHWSSWSSMQVKLITIMSCKEQWRRGIRDI